mmetsp:Transcript_14229/g.21502  ORF Transcript_14229/g.21502 Transcript_14229/m.21502 type:complete len:689 (-) Transcript_14229:323-2389(-)
MSAVFGVGRGIGVLGGGGRFQASSSGGRGRGSKGGRKHGRGRKKAGGWNKGKKRRFRKELTPAQKAQGEVKYHCRVKNLEGALAAYTVAKANGFERMEAEVFQALLAVCSGVSERASRRAPKGQPWKEPEAEEDEGRARKKSKTNDEDSNPMELEEQSSMLSPPGTATEQDDEEENADGGDEQDDEPDDDDDEEEEEKIEEDFGDDEGEDSIDGPSKSRRRAVAFEIYEDMRRLGIPLSEAVGTMLIRVCCLDDAVDEACTIIEEIKQIPGIKMRLRTYSPLIRCYARLGRLEDAIALKAEARSFNINLSETEHISIVACCAAINAEKTKAYSVLESMANDVATLSTKASWETIQSALKIKGQTDVSVDASGKCSGCNRSLLSLELNDIQREQLLNQIDSLVVHQELLQVIPDNNTPLAPDAIRRSNQWKVFKSWLHQRQAEDGPIDFVIDGANVGYFKQNYAGAPDHVDFHNIDSVLQHCLSAYLPRRKSMATSQPSTSVQTKFRNRVLIILHARHLAEDRMPYYAHEIVKRWRSQKQIYSCAIKNNDDWYWLYAAVAAGDNCYLVSNDEMRDHHFDMLGQDSFLNWKERHLTKFDFGPFQRHGSRPVDLSLPPPFSIRMQRAIDNPDIWHVPVQFNLSGQDSNALSLAAPQINQSIIIQRPDITQVAWLCLGCCPVADEKEEAGNT